MFLCVCVFFLLLSRDARPLAPVPSRRALGMQEIRCLESSLWVQYSFVWGGCPNPLCTHWFPQVKGPHTQRNFRHFKPCLATLRAWCGVMVFGPDPGYPGKLAARPKIAILNRHEKKHTKKKRTKEYLPNRPRGHPYAYFTKTLRFEAFLFVLF